MKSENSFSGKQHNRNPFSRRALAMILTVLFSLTVVGCKPSPALRDFVYDNRVDRVHPSETKELENHQDNTDPDEQIPPERFDQTGTERDRERRDPLPADEEHPRTTEGTAPAPEYAQNMRDSLQGIQVQENTASSQSGAQASEGSSNNHVMGNNNGSASGSGTGTAENSLPDGNDSEREIVDDNGEESEVPEQASSLTAVGNAALIVEMLGGGDRMIFSSESLKVGMASRMFDTSATQALWQGNGQAPLSAQDFQLLLDSAPAACLEVSGQTTFSEEQVQEMRSAGIEYAVLPAITSLSSACQAVDQTAKLIGTRKAEEKSEEFQKFCSDIESFVSGRTSAYSPDGINYEDGSSNYSLSESNGVLALYISAWDASAHYLLHNESVALEGNGAALVRTGYYHHPVTAFLSQAGVANASALSENNYSLTPNSVKIRYVNPVVNSLYNLDITGGVSEANFTKEYVYTATSLGNLGEDRYHDVIVPEESVRQAILSDGLWKVYPYRTSSGGHSAGYGFPDKNGSLVETTIHGNYEISVMPQGAGDWNNGSAESVMIPVWTLWKIRGLADRTEMVGYLQEFYQKFYQYTLSDTEIRQILVD